LAATAIIPKMGGSSSSMSSTAPHTLLNAGPRRQHSRLRTAYAWWRRSMKPTRTP
jgi:hypothetical protein